MSAKPLTQPADPTFAPHRVAPEAQVSTGIADASLAPSGSPQARHAAAQTMDAQPILLRLPMVMRITGLARSTIYKLISQNQFPVPIRLSKRAVAWLQSEIDGWVSSRARALSRIRSRCSPVRTRDEDSHGLGPGEPHRRQRLGNLVLDAGVRSPTLERFVAVVKRHSMSLHSQTRASWAVAVRRTGTTGSDRNTKGPDQKRAA